MIDATVQNRTALSPEWDRWFDEQFTDLISTDEELLRAEFDDLMASSWPRPPSHPTTPGPRPPSHPSPSGPLPADSPEPAPPVNPAMSPHVLRDPDRKATRPPPDS